MANYTYHAPKSETTQKSGSLGKMAYWQIRRFAKEFTGDIIINSWAEVQAETKQKPLNQIKMEIALDLFAEIQKWVLDVPIKVRAYTPPCEEEQLRRVKMAEESRKKRLAKLAKEKAEKENLL